MNAYEATMKAADWIEKNPHKYDFHSITVPNDEFCPRCMLGEIGRQIGMPKGTFVSFVAPRVGFNSDHEFYNCIPDSLIDFFLPTFHMSAYGAVRYMRRVARKYRTQLEAITYRIPDGQSIPDWLAIATATNAYRPAQERVK